MTLPDERYRAMLYAKRFLLDLCDPKMTPKVPSHIRQEARSVLRHYPTDYDLMELAKNNPDLLDPERVDIYSDKLYNVF